MIPHALLSLMLASPPAAVNSEVLPTYDLGKITWTEAKRLEGKQVRVSFKIRDQCSIDDLVIISVAGNDGVSRTATGRHGLSFLDRTKPVLAEGVIRASIDPAEIFHGIHIPETKTIRLEDARSIRP